MSLITLIEIYSPLPRNGKTTVVEVALVLQIAAGVLASVCNILFIWFGILSGWYDVTPELKVISVGEGIIAGVLYFVFAGSSLFILHCQQRSSHGVFLTLNIVVVILRFKQFLFHEALGFNPDVLSFLLAVVNACQLGLVHWFRPESQEEELRENSLQSNKMINDYISKTIKR